MWKVDRITTSPNGLCISRYLWHRKECWRNAIAQSLKSGFYDKLLFSAYKLNANVFCLILFEHIQFLQFMLYILDTRFLG